MNKLQLKLSKDNVLAAVRTAGGLMIGNVFVGVALLDKRDFLPLFGLLVFGFFVIIMASLSKETTK